ncbi:MAG: DNA (cytosine-5-)-methyltransferase [Candidatus Binatus sp.]|uniref:DNA (cytosine-5-)-methyltransferase n=1 Tax=Candidatus Binatus sp. TaxID=2811406 RepID=UPI003C7620A4
MTSARFAHPTFIDLFCGIGGMRLAFESAGGRCVFSSDWDKFAQQTYAANFGEAPHGDLRKITSDEIPDHNILVGGFPCQPFSISGVSKKNSLGRAHGFADRTQGTLFFEIARVIRDKQPEAFLLENVKNLVGHNRGRTFEVIRQTLEKDLDYFIEYRVLDAAPYVPQHRERLYIVGFREPRNFAWPDSSVSYPSFRSILDRTPDDKYTLTTHLWDYLKRYAKKHREAGNGFGYSLADLEGVSRTLSARYYKDGSEILISRGPGKNPRRLTPRECARLMGFPESFVIPVSDTQAYKQFGNSVVVPLISDLASQIVDALRSPVVTVPKQLDLLAAD